MSNKAINEIIMDYIFQTEFHRKKDVYGEVKKTSLTDLSFEDFMSRNFYTETELDKLLPTRSLYELAKEEITLPLSTLAKEELYN